MKETLLGTFDSKVTPLTLNFLSLDNSKYGFKDSDLIWVVFGIIGSFGGAIDDGKKQRKTEDK